MTIRVFIENRDIDHSRVVKVEEYYNGKSHYSHILKPGESKEFYVHDLNNFLISEQKVVEKENEDMSQISYKVFRILDYQNITVLFINESGSIYRIIKKEDSYDLEKMVENNWQFIDNISKESAVDYILDSVEYYVKQ